MRPVSRSILCTILFFLSTAALADPSDDAHLWNSPRFQDDAKSLYATASAITPPAGVSVIVLDLEESYSFNADGAAVHTHYFLYKVLSQDGVDGWDSVSQEWEPWREQRPTLKARVITPDFAIHTLDPKSIADAPVQEEENNVYSDRRVLRAPLPAIAPGSLVEEEETVIETSAFFKAGTVSRIYTARTAPVHTARVSLDYPSSVPIHYDLQLLPDLKPSRKEENGRIKLLFEIGPTEAEESADAYLPSEVSVFPHISFSTGNSWKEVAAAYSKVVDTQLASTDVKSVTSKIIAGKSMREERAAAIIQFLAREIRYTGVEFGESSITPHPPSETLKHKYGDCKDKSALLVAMLRAADIPAYVALLNAGERQDVPKDLPGFGLFDHAIVYAPGNPDWWIDATDTYARLGQLPDSDRGRFALVARDDSEALTLIPRAASKDNLLLEKREFFLAENGPARVLETSQPHGAIESEYRAYYSDQSNKERKKRLVDYVKEQYLADKLERVQQSEPADFSKPFELVLEATGAKRGATDLLTAVAAIRLEGLFARVPSELQQKEEAEDKKNQEQTGKHQKSRIYDYVLPQTHVVEWQYKIIPPPGFRPKPLPPNSNVPVGPAVLTEKFSTEKDGTVHADLRFDTVKQRLTPAEASELRENILKLRAAEPVLIYFEPTAQALMNEGKMRDAFQAYRDMVGLHPKEAVHHLQLGQALLDAGMGQAARDEANLAVMLEPKSPLAYKTLALILESDLVGRKFRRGSDFIGAQNAFREAKKLDPEDKEIPGNLAILLEYDLEGERYGPSAKLKEASAEYRTLKQEDLAGIGLQNNLAYALMYSGEFAAARKYAESLSPQIGAVIVACEGILKGTPAALAEAQKRSEGDTQRKQLLKTSGEIAIRARQYAVASDLLAAGASGQNASSTMALASMVKNAHPHETMSFPNDATGLVLQLFALLGDADLTIDKMLALSSRTAQILAKKKELDDPGQSLKSAKQIRTLISRSGFPADIMMDIVMQAIQPKTEGDDANGYRVILRMPGAKNITMYVVKEDGKYKALDSSEKPDAVGLEILDLLAVGNLAGARTLLDWVREDQHLAGGDDPLEGFSFPRMWTKGKEADAAHIKWATAALLVQSEDTAKQGVAILEEARPLATSDTEKLNLALALLEGYSQSREFARLHDIALELENQYPESKRLFQSDDYALRLSGRSNEADQLARDRLKRFPEDVDAMRALETNAVAREDYLAAYQAAKDISTAGKAEANDLNSLAWNSLFTGKTAAEDAETAVKAAQLSQNAPGILHTLGCVYAELGKTKEAREILIQAMDALTLDEPDSNYWYAFGRIAEQYGETAAATSDFQRIPMPKRPYQIPGSAYRLAQNRLKVLVANSSSAVPQKH